MNNTDTGPGSLNGLTVTAANGKSTTKNPKEQSREIMALQDNVTAYVEFIDLHYDFFFALSPPASLHLMAQSFALHSALVLAVAVVYAQDYAAGQALYQPCGSRQP